MKPHPLTIRIDSLAPVLAKLPNSIRHTLYAVLADVRSHLEQIQHRSRKAGLAARGYSGRPALSMPPEALPYLRRINAGELSVAEASSILKSLLPDSQQKFSPNTLRKWAATLRSS